MGTPAPQVTGKSSLRGRESAVAIHLLSGSSGKDGLLRCARNDGIKYAVSLTDHHRQWPLLPLRHSKSHSFVRSQAPIPPSRPANRMPSRGDVVRDGHRAEGAPSARWPPRQRREASLTTSCECTPSRDEHGGRLLTGRRRERPYRDTINVPASAPAPCVIESDGRLFILNPLIVTNSLSPAITVLVAFSVKAGLLAEP